MTAPTCKCGHPKDVHSGDRADDFGCLIPGCYDSHCNGWARCRYVSPTPWGPSRCCLPGAHDGRHAYSPSEGSMR